jgi:uncharacterized membrane protein
MTMTATLDAFAIWLRATAISEAIRSGPWLWPACEIAHFVGLSLLVGVVGFFDLRLLGLFRRVPLNAAWSLMSWGKLGFAIAAMTGVTFFIGAPDQYINNVAFYAKLVFLLIAGLNAAAFEIFYSDAVKASAAVNVTPLVYRAIALVSMVSWFFVIYWGRMLPFVGNAF